MSDRDSFIEEVSEEVRKDRLFGLLRKYGWIAALAVFALVGGAAWNEYTKAQTRNAAEALGDALLAALENDTPEGRAAALEDLQSDSAGGAAVLGLLTAAQEASAGRGEAATARLEAIATNPELPQIYRQIAAYKGLLAGAESLDPATRRTGFEALTTPGNPLRLLAEEQLALIDLAAGDRDAARDRLNRIVTDSEATAGLVARAGQVLSILEGAGPGA